MYNALAIAQNAIVSIALKVEDNILHIMMAQVIALEPTIPINPAVNLLHAFLKAPSALVVKQVCIIEEAKTTKLWPKLAKAWAQQQYKPYVPMSVVP